MLTKVLVVLAQKKKLLSQPDSGMTLLETSLSLLFMAMFFMALLAASMGVNRMTRGFTCRVLSADPLATEPTRGCAGEDDEVVGTDINRLRLEHHDGFRALRDDIRSTQKAPINISITPAEVAIRSAFGRYDVLKNKCLWEKLEPIRGGRFRASRNFFVIDPKPYGAGVSVSDGSVPPPQGSHIWFIRGGHLIGERWTGSSLEPLPSLGNIDEALISESSQFNRPQWIQFPRTEQELGEPSGSLDPILNAPNTGWGLLNQVCLFQGSQDIAKNVDLRGLYLLSGERGSDLGNQDAPFFGREEGMSSRQPQPRLLFSMP